MMDFVPFSSFKFYKILEYFYSDSLALHSNRGYTHLSLTIFLDALSFVRSFARTLRLFSERFSAPSWPLAGCVLYKIHLGHTLVHTKTKNSLNLYTSVSPSLPFTRTTHLTDIGLPFRSFPYYRFFACSLACIDPTCVTPLLLSGTFLISHQLLVSFVCWNPLAGFYFSLR